MEGLSSLKGLSGTKVVKRNTAASDPLAGLTNDDPLAGLTSGDKQHRVGARMRAFAFFAEAAVKASNEGWSVEELAEYVASCQDETKVPSAVKLSGKGKQTYFVGKSARGNFILLQVLPSAVESLKGDFVSLWRFGKKNDALDLIQGTGDNVGVQVF
jgi:hypothetical protein